MSNVLRESWCGVVPSRHKYATRRWRRFFLSIGFSFARTRHPDCSSGRAHWKHGGIGSQPQVLRGIFPHNTIVTMRRRDTGLFRGKVLVKYLFEFFVIFTKLLKRPSITYVPNLIQYLRSSLFLDWEWAKLSRKTECSEEPNQHDSFWTLKLDIKVCDFFKPSLVINFFQMSIWKVHFCWFWTRFKNFYYKQFDVETVK